MRPDVTVVIPTYGRDEVLVQTVQAVLALVPAPSEVVIVDQTPAHEEETLRRLAEWDAAGRVSWVRLAKPSIPNAMNEGLRRARSPVVLFLDDDSIPFPDLIAAHARAYAQEGVTGVAGMVLQPGQVPEDVDLGDRGDGLTRDLGFPFNSLRSASIANCMAGNLSVDRQKALTAGGFDQNFVGVSYRFETEFARRLIRTSGQVLYEPSARIHHLRAQRGGTRSIGSHLTSGRPDHGVGDYYFALVEGRGLERFRYIVRRLFREVRTKFHARHPWWIPVKLMGEMRAIVLAAKLWRRGPRHLPSRTSG